MHHSHMNCPPEFLDLFVARATLNGPIATDIMTVREMLDFHRKILEDCEARAACLPEGTLIPCWGILGFYRDRDQASVALDWVRAWRDGS
jgi:hypothetical protein